MQNEPNNLNNGQAYEIDLNNMPKATLQGHMWRQIGTQLVCQSCPFTHADFIEPGKQLYGIDQDGVPLIRDIVVKS